MGKFTVPRILPDSEIDIIPLSVGVPLFQKGPYQPDHRIQVFCGPRFLFRGEYAQSVHVAVKRFNIDRSNFGYRPTGLLGFPYDFVVNVRDVPDIADPVPKISEEAVKEIEDGLAPGMPEVTVVIDSHTAYIHGHHPWGMGEKGFGLLCQRIFEDGYRRKPDRTFVLIFNVQCTLQTGWFSEPSFGILS